MYYDPLAPTTPDADSPMPPDQNGGNYDPPENPNGNQNGNQNGGSNNDGTITPPNVCPPEAGQPTPLPNDSIDPNLLSLAMAFVPYQAWENPYANDVGLSRGTIFPSLDKPFLGERPLSESTPRWEV